MPITGKTLLAGVVGWPVAHSRSPLIHNHWLEKYRIDGVYVALPVAPGGFESAMKGLAVSGFRGVNVTLPWKEAALALADEADDGARAIGAANTLVFHPGGRIEARNTDAHGFIANLRSGAPDWRPHGKAVVLGAGGAARAVAWALLQEGMRVVLVNRTLDRAEVLTHSLNGDITALDWSRVHEALEDACLLVNTTSLGMTGQPELDIDLSALPRACLVNDIVYTPLETGLLAAARVLGNSVVDGLGMLLHQAAPGFEAWFGVRPEVDDALRRAVLAG